MTPETQQPGNGPTRREADIYDLLAWLEVNRKKVGLAVLLLILIGFGVATARYLNEQKELNASTALLELRPTLTPQTNVPPPQASSFLSLAENYSGTQAAERAQFLAASTLFLEEKYAEAERQFAQFAQAHPGSPWAAAAAYGQATALEAQNKATEAMAAYQQIATAYPNSAVADNAKLAMARIYEARNEPEQALRIYNDLLPVTAGAQPAMGSAEAYSRKEALLKLNPQLATNQPPAPALSATTSVPVETNTPPPAENAAPEAAPAAPAETPPPAEDEP